MSKNKQGSSNIINVMKDFKDIIEIKKIVEVQQNTIKILKNKINELEVENKNLKLKIPKDNSNIVRIQISPEESIITEQIDYLRGASVQRVLSIEEVKKLDLLVKNLKLIKSEPTTIMGKSQPLENISEAKLLELAEKDHENE